MSIYDIKDDVYAYIKSYTSEHQFSPTRRDVSKHFGISVSSAQLLIEELRKEKLITTVPGIPRSIVVTSAMKEREVTL